VPRPSRTATPLVTSPADRFVLPRAEADQLLICAIALVVVTLVAGGFQMMQGNCHAPA